MRISSQAQKTLFSPILFFLVLGLSFSQIIVTSPSSRDEVRSCADYADEVLQDRWDMNERTDLGWRIFNTVEQPRSYLTGISFQNGVFSAQSVYTPDVAGPDYSDTNIAILDSAYLGSAGLGKVGANYPINADKYKVLAIRMYLEPDIYGPWGQLLWSTDTIYSGSTASGSFYTYNNWFIYLIDISSLGIVSGTDSWSGYIDSLRMDPVIKKNKTIQIDWIRLVEYKESEERDITWIGASGNVDIYLDNDRDSSNGHLGMLAKNISGNKYTFLTGALAQGDYYIAVTPTGTSSYTYSAGYYHVNDTPIMQFIKPSAAGSDTDYVNVAFSDPWDMSNSADVEHTVNINNAQFKSINYQDMAGNSYPSQSVYYGESISVSPPFYGDPTVFFLHFLYRGGQIPIDSSHYHNLVFKMGIDGIQSVNDGSIARVMWRRNDESVENVSQDIVIRHLASDWIMNKVVCDLSELPLEGGGGSPSQSGWTGEIDCFRIDPHELRDSRAFFFDEVRITADWKANISFPIEWIIFDENTVSVSLYYDIDNAGFNGTPIVQSLSSSAGAGSYNWDTSVLAEGKYWIYMVADDGVNQNSCYAGGPVIVDHELIPEINLSKEQVIFGAELNGAVTSYEKVYIRNSGQGSLNWQATTNRNWITISPTSGSGEGCIDIGIAMANPSPGTYYGVVEISDPKALNSPRFIDVTLTVYAHGGDSLPFGMFETPIAGDTVSGTIAVTGWALDDIEVTQIQIKRNSHVDDPSSVIGPDGLVYVQDAVFIEGARPDVEIAYPNYPRSNKAGWGSMVLTNFLPNKGNGSFIFHVFALDGSGHCVEIGQKMINADNANRIKPFGTIDTPAVGECISGNDYINFGWALTPSPKKIPEDGSTIWVWIDGQPVGHPDYGYYREDIATLFPGYLNSNGAVGYFNIDTTAFENGMHYIAWSVEDNAGDADGMGLRNFFIQNMNGFSIGQEALCSQEDPNSWLHIEVRDWKQGYRRQERQGQASGQLAVGRDSKKPVDSWQGKQKLQIEVEEVERLEIHLTGQGGNEFIGWGSNKNQPLPEGSTLDKEKGIFYWIPCPGFLGRHILHFAVTDGEFYSIPIEVMVNIVPKVY